jgi:hypothetical protein
LKSERNRSEALKLLNQGFLLCIRERTSKPRNYHANVVAAPKILRIWKREEAREFDWITVYFDGGPQVVHGKKSEVKKWFSIKGYLN